MCVEYGMHVCGVWDACMCVECGMHVCGVWDACVRSVGSMCAECGIHVCGVWDERGAQIDYNIQPVLSLDLSQRKIW